MNKLFDFKEGEVLHIFSKSEMVDLKNQWIEVFCKNSQGARLNHYLWHIFNYNRYDSISGEDAEKIYFKHKALEYIIASDDFSVAILTDELPISCELCDFHVFPKNIAWSMTFTHEDGYYNGPYFAKHKNYDKLNLQNLLKIKKFKQIELAKQKGWL